MEWWEGLLEYPQKYVVSSCGIIYIYHKVRNEMDYQHIYHSQKGTPALRMKFTKTLDQA